MSSKSAPRVTLITGGGTGIGAAVARRLTSAGEQVAVCGRRAAPLAEVASETGGLAVAADVSTPDGATAAVSNTLDRFGRIDGLVLNAGMSHVGPVDQLTIEQWDESLRVNLTAAFLVARAAIEPLRQSSGSIVAVSSVAGLRSGPGMVSYSTAKAGLIAMCKGMAVDHASEGIRVNCVCPGWTRTPMADSDLMQSRGEAPASLDAAYAFATRLVPQRRAAEADEIAAAICWLLSPDASYVTGASLVVDGGTVLVDAGNLPADLG